MENKDWIELGALVATVVGILWRLAVAVGRFEQIGKQQAGEITEMKESMKEMKTDFNKGLSTINSVLLTLSEQTGRITLVEERQLLQGKRMDETITRMNNHLDALALPKLAGAGRIS